MGRIGRSSRTDRDAQYYSGTALYFRRGEASRKQVRNVRPMTRRNDCRYDRRWRQERAREVPRGHRVEVAHLTRACGTSHRAAAFAFNFQGKGDSQVTRKLQRLAILGGVLLFVACTAAPIVNVQNSPVNVSKSNPTLEDVSKAIVRAGVGLGWQMTPQKPGLMQGRLALREHVAVVDIKYDRKSYSIDYKDSNNLNYDASQQKIHRNYNGWIQRLDNAIQAQLSAL